MRFERKSIRPIFITCVFIYLFIGVIYALGPGYYKHELLGRVQDQLVDVNLDEILCARYLGDGNLYLCVLSSNKNKLLYVPLNKIRGMEPGSTKDGIEELYVSGALIIGPDYLSEEGCEFKFQNYQDIEIESKSIYYSSLTDVMKKLDGFIPSSSDSISVIQLKNGNISVGEEGIKVAVLSGRTFRSDYHVLLLEMAQHKVAGSRSERKYLPIAFLGDMLMYPYHFYILLQQK